MTRSDAQKKADKKYIAKTYKRYAVNTRREFVPQIEQYMERNDIKSSSALFNGAVQYVIEHNIKIKK